MAKATPQVIVRVSEETKGEVYEIVHEMKQIYLEFSQNETLKMILDEGMKVVKQKLENGDFSKAELRYRRFNNEIEKETVIAFYEQLKLGHGYKRASEKLSIDNGLGEKIFQLLRDMGNVYVSGNTTAITDKPLKLDFM